jgi:tRNA(adenine34) deaminase
MRRITALNEVAQYEKWMNEALIEARRAFSEDEVPVGAIIIQQNEIIARAYNRRETDQNPLGHAEILAIDAAAKRLGRWRLNDCALVVTLEPCAMCAGALVNARLAQVVFAAKDPKAGACGSVFNVAANPTLNHRLDIVSGILEEDARQLLQDFFKNKRA